MSERYEVPIEELERASRVRATVEEVPDAQAAPSPGYLLPPFLDGGGGDADGD